MTTSTGLVSSTLGRPATRFRSSCPTRSTGVFLLLVPLFMFIHYLFTFKVDLFPAYEIALAMVATSLIFRYVDPDRPARTVIRTALTDWRHTREPDQEQRDARLVASKVRIREEIAVTGKRSGPLTNGKRGDMSEQQGRQSQSHGNGTWQRRTVRPG